MCGMKQGAIGVGCPQMSNSRRPRRHIFTHSLSRRQPTIKRWRHSCSIDNGPTGPTGPTDPPTAVTHPTWRQIQGLQLSKNDQKFNFLIIIIISLLLLFCFSKFQFDYYFLIEVGGLDLTMKFEYLLILSGLK